MKFKICLYGVFLIIIILYVGGCRKAGSWLVMKDEVVHSDAIVILMGSIADRVLQAVDLYQFGASGKIIIVEVANDGYRELKVRGADIISSTRQFNDIAVALGIPPDSILILQGDACSTQDEALIIRDYLANQAEIDSLLLVTSSHHSRRAKMIFEKAFRKSKKPVYFFCTPNYYTSFNADKWWKSKDDIEIVLMQYLKLANYLLVDRWKL
jgi:uncharacterized SAM-binding protein YcdF (DUF218 family)